jgi:hypothetical protein
MQNQVIRDPAVWHCDSFRVIFNSRLCSPNFNSRGAAKAYLQSLETGKRKPEYVQAYDRRPLPVTRSKST